MQQAQEKLRDAAARSEQLLNENNGEEAVNHIWWLLESISIVFVGLTINGRRIEGDYFNVIFRNIRQAAGSSLLSAAARWLSDLQSYLSGPDQAGIRHGRHLNLPGLRPHEAALLCNLSRSYIAYLLAECERIRADEARFLKSLL